MKKISILLLGVLLCHGTTQSMSFPARAGNFILESLDRGFNGKKTFIFAALCSSMYLACSDEKLEIRKRIAQSVGVMLAAIGACGVADAVRVRVLPNSPDAIAEREAEQKLKEKIAQHAVDLERRKKEHVVEMARIRAEHAAHLAEANKNRVRREFYKALAVHKNEPCEQGCLPESCMQIAQEYSALYGAQKYQEELSAFHSLRGRNTKQAAPRQMA